MLVLSRKINEVICIGDDIQIRVLEMNGPQVRLGIDAPKHIAVHRHEVYVRILEEQAVEKDTDETGL